MAADCHGDDGSLPYSSVTGPAGDQFGCGVTSARWCLASPVDIQRVTCGQNSLVGTGVTLGRPT